MNIILTTRPIGHDEAREIASRLIAGAFGSHDKKRPHFSIPADKELDDDLLMCAYIEQQRMRDDAPPAASPARAGA